MINNLKILNDYKKDDYLYNFNLNNALIYGSLITVNLIDVIKEYYKLEEIQEINSFTDDSYVKSFFENSLSNFFLDNYINSYHTDNNPLGYIKNLNQIVNSSGIKYTNNNYSLSLFDFTNTSGNIKIGYKNDYLYINHNNNVDYNNYYSAIIGTNGYNTILNLNSYKLDKFGHIKENIKRTVTFPSLSKIRKIISTDENMNSHIDKASSFNIQLNDPYYYFTMFIFTFYNSNAKTYFTVPFSSQELYLNNGTHKFIHLKNVSSDGTWYIILHIRIENDYIKIYVSPYDSTAKKYISLKKVKAFTIN